MQYYTRSTLKYVINSASFLFYFSKKSNSKLMKKTIIITILLITFSVKSQESKLIGNWFVTQVKTPEKTQEVYMFVEFTKENKLIIRNLEFANWKIEGDSLIMKSKIKKSFNGARKIIKLNNKEMILKKENETIYYKRYNPKEISEDSNYKKIIGVWNINESNKANYLNFKKNGDFVMLSLQDEGTIITKGVWFFITSDKFIIIDADIDILRGKSTMFSIHNSDLILKQNGKKYKATKIFDSKKIKPLNFSEENLSQNSNTNSKLPWVDKSLVLQYHKLNKLIYEQNEYFKEIDRFISKEIIWDCVTDLETNEINILITENKKQLESRNKDKLTNLYNPFFPETDLYLFKIVSTDEQVTVPAGTYSCTVIEGIDGEIKYKYYMINNMPGVYAKVITQSEGMFGNVNYRITELNTVKAFQEKKKNSHKLKK